MNVVRIIPCLDVKDGRVVKGINFVNLRDARDPVEAAEAYCREGADELVFLDIFATVESRKTRFEWVENVCEVVTVPFTVGGGIASLEDMQALFDLGVNKVSINTAAVRNPELIREASKKSQVIISTQSVTFINHFEPENIIIVDRENEESLFKRLKKKDLSEWLKEYSVGEIWEKNIIRGTP